MKRIFSIFLAVVMVVLAVTVTASAANQSAVAAIASTAPTIDGVKDTVYTSSTPLNINQAVTGSADDVNGKAYFAYDNEYLYVFVEVNDATKADKVVDKKGIIDGTNGTSCNSGLYNDAVSIQFNFDNTSYWSAIWGVGSVNANNDGSGLYMMCRNGTNAHMGGHVFCKDSDGHENSYYFKSAVKEGTNGYTVECRIPFGVDISGNAFNVNTIIENGMSVILQITDGYTVNASDSTKGDATNVVVSNKRWNTAAFGDSGMSVSGYTDGYADKLTLYVETPDAIEIASTPTKTSYNVGEVLNLAGLTVKAIFNHGEPNESKSVVDLSDCTISLSGGLQATDSFTSAGDVTVTVEYKSLTATFDVTVADNALKDGTDGLWIETQPTKTSYVEGETFNAAGLVIKACFVGETTANDVTALCSYVPTGALTTADTKITYTYLGRTVEVPITVAAKTLTGIEIATQPTFKTYTGTDKKFDSTGLTVNAVYNNGAIKENVALSDLAFYLNYGETNQADATVTDLAVGQNVVTIAYSGYTATVTVTYRENEYASYMTHERPANPTVDGVKDSLYSDTPSFTIDSFVGLGGSSVSTTTKADVYMVYTTNGMYFLLDVTDNTKQSTFITNGSMAVLSSPYNFSPAAYNDCVLIGINAGDKTYGDLTKTDAAGIVGVYRSVGAETTSTLAFDNNSFCGGIGITRSGCIKDKADGSGYIAELFVPFTDAISLEKLKNNEIDFQIEVVNSNGAVAGATDTAAEKAKIIYAYSNPNMTKNWKLVFSDTWNGALWVWNNDTIFTAGANGYDRLKANQMGKLTVDTTNGKIAYVIGEKFTIDGIKVYSEMEETHDKLYFDDFDVTSSIYLNRAFSEVGTYRINVVRNGVTEDWFDITVTEGSAYTGDSTMTFVPYVAAVAVIALAGAVVLWRRKKNEA